MGRPKEDGVRVTVYNTLLVEAEKQIGFSRTSFMSDSEMVQFLLRWAIQHAVKDREKEVANVKIQTG